MIATIRFKLPEEQIEYDTMMQAGKMHSALHEIMTRVLHRKRDFEDVTGEQVFQTIREEVFEVLRDQGIEL